MNVVGHGLVEGYLDAADVASVVSAGLASLPVDGQSVLVLIPDSTRTMPMPQMFELLERLLGPRVAALDYLVALGTHAAMSESQLARLIGRAVEHGRAGRSRILNHRWEDPATFATLGTIPADETFALTQGRLRQDVPVALNRLVLNYDHVLICGPVFPHEVAGFSGGTKYLVPGIAGPAIIDFTHWLGALIGSAEVIGTRDTPVRAVIDHAARFVDRPLWLLAPVVSPEGIAGLYCGEVHEAWRAAAGLSARRHVTWLERPLRRVLSVLPEMYTDLWTAAKGFYKVEPAVADGGEVILYAPHVREVSSTHGRLIEQIGYHCRDYILAHRDRFARFPGGVLAHSTHLTGQGHYDPSTGVETPRLRVLLATGISEERCLSLNLGYADPAGIDPGNWYRGDADALVVPRAGERLYRVGAPPPLG